MTRGAIAVAVCSMLAAACGAEDPGPGGYDPLGTAGAPQQPGDPAAAEGSAAQAMSVVVDPLGNSTTCYERIAIQGTATPGSDVYALGGSATSDIVAAHPQTGRFCIDVPLRRDEVNQLEVWAKHAELGPADPATITVTHDSGAAGCSAAGPATTSTTPKLVNVALGAPVISKHGPKDNSNRNVTDGDPKTWASWGGGSWYNPTSNYDGWVMVTLSNIAEAEKVVIRWRDRKGSGGKYATKYRFLYTAMSTESLDEDDGKWVMPSNGDVKSGDGGTDEFKLNGEPVRQVAVRLLQNGEESYNEDFAIAEIEIVVDENRGNTPVVSGEPGSCGTVSSY